MRRRWTIRVATIAAALIAGAFALAAAGCGGSDEPDVSSVDAWASGFCTAVTSWTDELRQIEADFTGDPSSFADAEVLREAVDSVSSATDEFVEDVRTLGAPDTESGEEIESSLNALADTLETARSDIEQAVEDVSELTDVAAAVTAIGTALSAMGTAFQTTLETIEDSDVQGELEQAFESSDACAELTR